MGKEINCRMIQNTIYKRKEPPFWDGSLFFRLITCTVKCRGLNKHNGTKVIQKDIQNYFLIKYFCKSGL